MLSKVKTIVENYNELKKSQDYVPLDDIPSNLKNAVICFEDRNFYKHHGIDFRGIARAFVRYISGKRQEGASTLTQQMVRTIVLGNKRTITRKVNEILLAVLIERKLTKDQIMELYLNRAYFGTRCVGIKKTAFNLFGKLPNELNLSECAFIAGILRTPLPLEVPNELLTKLISRQRYILDLMLKADYIEKSQYDIARIQEVRLRVKLTKYDITETPVTEDMYDDIIRKYSRDYDIPFALIKAIIKKESIFFKRATSHKNTRGLMQLKDDTFKEMVEKYFDKKDADIYDPDDNIHAGTLYIRRLLDRWDVIPEDERINFALASYNSGPSNILKAIRILWDNKEDWKKWNNIKRALPTVTGEQTEVTIQYVSDVLGYMKKYDKN